MTKKGYGDLIAKKRTDSGMSPEELAKAIGRKTKTTVYKMESESQEPTADDINALVTVLPMSSYELLRSLGLRLPWTKAGEIEDRLLDILIGMTPDQRRGLLAALEPTMAAVKAAEARRL